MAPANVPIARVLCVGASTTDRYGETSLPAASLHTSNIGQMRRCFGGAARNVAENLARLGIEVLLSTVVGDDSDGGQTLAATTAAGVAILGDPVLPGRRTASYTAIFDGAGELVIGLADMEIMEHFEPREAAGLCLAWSPGTLLFADANLPSTQLSEFAANKRGPLAVGAVSAQKSIRIADILASVDYLFLNRYEAEAMIGKPASTETLARNLLARGARRGVLTLGAEGVLAWEGDTVQSLPALPARATNVNGAGDTFVAATLARLVAGDAFFLAADRARAAAALTVEVEATVNQELTMDLLLNRWKKGNP